MREWLSGGAPPCQGGGRGFDPRLALEGGFRICTWRHLAKVGVAGSIPVSRSREGSGFARGGRFGAFFFCAEALYYS